MKNPHREESDPPDYLGPNYRDVLTISDLARFFTLNRSEKYIYRLLRETDFPLPIGGRQRGSTNLWLKRDVNAWLHHHRWKPKEEALPGEINKGVNGSSL